MLSTSLSFGAVVLVVWWAWGGCSNRVESQEGFRLRSPPMMPYEKSIKEKVGFAE
jgi:hypothetical protein